MSTELLSEALTHYTAAAALQESSDCARPTPFASRLATEGLSAQSAGFSSGRSVSLQTWQRDRHSGARRASVQVGKGGVLAAMAQVIPAPLLFGRKKRPQETAARVPKRV